MPEETLTKSEAADVLDGVIVKRTSDSEAYNIQASKSGQLTLIQVEGGDTTGLTAQRFDQLYRAGEYYIPQSPGDVTGALSVLKE